MIDIPPDRLPRDTLEAIVESFVLREGTDYGDREFSLTSKIAQVIRQIEKGEIVITYDSVSETCNLITCREWLKINKGNEQNND